MEIIGAVIMVGLLWALHRGMVFQIYRGPFKQPALLDEHGKAFRPEYRVKR